MCGIAGIIGVKNIQHERTLEKMLSSVEHRGRPETLYENDGVMSLQCFLGTNRLPIVQKESNQQPAISPNSKFMVAMNGQIFNYKEIEDTLRSNGFLFNVSNPGDTVVLAAALEHWGLVETLGQLVWEGVFLAIDIEKKTLFTARDHIGIKPLYYCRVDDNTYFASELKAFQSCGKAESIHQVDPGTFIQFSLPDGREISCEKWWSGLENIEFIDEVEAIEGSTFKLLKEAVKCRVPDTPYAILLSGGIDSSLILKLAVEFNNSVTAYVLCKKNASPDLPYARQICSDLNVKLVEIEADSASSLYADLPNLISCLETWEWHVVNHAAPMNNLFKAIRQDGHKVVLTGEGADELFFGYETYTENTNYNQLEDERLRRVSDLHRTNCQRIDRMGMKHGLECRVPFLDKNLTEFALSLPASSCLMPGINKKPLRDIAKTLFSKSFSERKKLSFARGVGYQYGSKESQSVFESAIEANDTELHSDWKDLPRYPLEELFLKYFLEAGYGRAPHLKTQSL